MMIKNRLVSKLLALSLTIIMLVSTFSVGLVFADEEPYYYLVVSADKESVETGSDVVVTVEIYGNGNTMARLRTYQMDLCYDTSILSYETTRTNPGFENEWYNEISTNFTGIGYVATPELDVINDGSGEGVRFTWYGSNKDYMYIKEDSDIYNSTKTIAAKFKFAASGQIADVSEMFKLKVETIAIDVDNYAIEKSNEVIQISDLEEASKVDDLIEALPNGDNINYSHKKTIEDARKAYEALSPVFLKQYVTKLDVLEAAEESFKSIQGKIDDVVTNIKAIGEVTLEDKTAITTARTAYDALANESKAGVASYDEDGVITNYFDVLTAAETKLAELEKEAKDREAAKIVIEKIKALDKTITLEDEAAIAEARRAYNEDLTPEQKVYVTSDILAILVNAEEDISTLNGYKDTAEELVKYIAGIPQGGAVTPENVDDVQGQIDSAKSSYATISNAGLASLVTNWELVEKAQTRVTELKDNIAAANSFVDKVESICSKVDLDSGDSITSAIHEYDDFNDEIKGFVAQAKEDLDKAKTRYDNMVNAKTLIDALPEVDLGAEPPINEVTPACGEALEAAEEAYNALNEEDKETIDEDNFSKLATVRKAYDKSVEDVKAATDAIDAIGDITLESKDKIIAAKTAYESLTVAEKEYLKTYNGQDYGAVLNNAYETYVGLVQDKEEADELQAGLVMSKIDALDNITLQSGESIANAENAYKALTDDQKTIVKSTKYGDSDKNYYERLQEIREIYDELVADNNAVQAVITAINNIGTVKYGGDDDSDGKILAAESAYNALAEADKASGKNLASQVANYSVLTTAREDYGILENIVTLIGGIGKAENTDEHLNKLNAAQAAYDALDDEDKPKAYLKEQLTDDKEALDAAWYEYKLLLVKYVQLDMTMSDGDAKKHVVFTNIPEGQMVALDGYTVSVMKLGEAVYNIIVTGSELSEEALTALKLVDINSADEPYMLGDVVVNDQIDANDAQAANQYAARVKKAVDYFTNDPMAFARADVNGSGTVTALDAFMIAQKGVNNESFNSADDHFAKHFENK